MASHGQRLSRLRCVGRGRPHRGTPAALRRSGQALQPARVAPSCRACAAPGMATASPSWVAVIWASSKAMLVRTGHRCDHGRMTAWRDVEQAEPEFAQRVRALFDAHRHKTLATLRADGSPRISGIESAFEDGRTGSWLDAERAQGRGSPPGSAVRPAQRHGRPGRGLGGAVAGRGEDLRLGDRCRTDHRRTGRRPLLHADIAEVVHTHLTRRPRCSSSSGGRPAHGLRRIERE